MADKNLSQQDEQILQSLIAELEGEMESLTSDMESLQRDVTEYRHKQDIKQALDTILSLKD